MFHLSRILFILTLIIVLSACSSNKKNTKEYEKLQSKPEFLKLKEQGMVKSLTISENILINEVDLNFTPNEVFQIGHGLRVKVQYGGGCVKPHIFELVTNGEISKKGNIQFWLLHKTHDDFCKALIQEELMFDISEITIFNQTKLKTIQLNDLAPISFTKFE